MDIETLEGTMQTLAMNPDNGYIITVHRTVPIRNWLNG